MIFVGDVAIAASDRFAFRGFPAGIFGVPWCINLEGAIAAPSQSLDWGVYNTSCWSESFAGFKLAPAFLANNHLDDLPDGVSQTLAMLRDSQRSGFGAACHKDEAAQATTVDSGTFQYVLVGFGWPVIGCRSVTRQAAGVNRLEGKCVRQTIKGLVEQNPKQRVIVVMHWNYEFERYPQPGHRRLAMDLIDLGAYAIIGHHPHIVGPVERYRGHTIAYSLGNWAFSYGRFFGGKLRFPPSSFAQIALELGETGDVVHHAQFSPPSDVAYNTAERVDCPEFSLRPDFEGMSDEDYLAWFKINRIKRLGLPIYRSADSSVVNRVKDTWVFLRQVGINVVVRVGIKKICRLG